MNFSIKQCRDNTTMIYPTHDMWMGKSIATYGESHAIEFAFLAQFLEAGDVVIDAGANIGTLTIPFAKAVGPTGKVYAFEAQRTIFHALCGNIVINDLQNVQAMNVAVDRNSMDFIYVPSVDYSKEGAYGSVALTLAPTDTVIETFCLDDLNLDQLKLLKIDVEGMEWDVIRGTINTINKLKPLIYFEIPNTSNLEEAKHEVKCIVQNLIQIGYSCKIHRPSVFNYNNFAGIKEDILRNHNAPAVPVTSFNVFCVANTKPL